MSCNREKNAQIFITNCYFTICWDYGFVDMSYDSSRQEETAITPIKSVLKFKVIGQCSSAPTLSDSEWFLDEEKGGPKSTTLFWCQLRKRSWEIHCGSNAKMAFSGPGQVINDKYFEWKFYDIDGTLVKLKSTITQTKNQSCYDMSRKSALPSTPVVHFCYPSLNIVDHPKAGTSALYYILRQHPNNQSAHPNKE